MIVRTLGAAVLIVAGTTPAAAIPSFDPDYYVGVTGQYAFPMDSDIVGTDLELGLDDGYGFGGVVGADFQLYRAELEVTHLQFDLGDISGPGGIATLNGDVSATLVMLNGAIDLVDDGEWFFTPFLGAGVGVALWEADLTSVTVGSTTVNASSSDSNADLALSASLGADIPIGDRFYLSPAYRFQWVDADDGVIDGLSSHMLMMTFRGSF